MNILQKSNRVHNPPPIIERLSQLHSYYNFNIIKTNREDDNGIKYDHYEYNQIWLDNPVTREKIKNTMIKVGLGDQTYIDMVDSDCNKLGID